MVEKPPLHTYDIYLEVEAHGGYGGIWRPFYLSYIYIFFSKIAFRLHPLLQPTSILHINFSKRAEAG